MQKMCKTMHVLAAFAATSAPKSAWHSSRQIRRAMIRNALFELPDYVCIIWRESVSWLTCACPLVDIVAERQKASPGMTLMRRSTPASTRHGAQLAMMGPGNL